MAQPQSLHDYASLDEVAARLMKTNPRLAAAKAAWLAGQWSAQRDDGRWHILGDAAHKRINPVTTRAEDTIALWSRSTPDKAAQILANPFDQPEALARALQEFLDPP